MKKLIFALSALAALSLLAPSSGFAQYNNHIGLYFDTDATEVEATVAPFSQTNVYVVVTNPYNDGEGRDVAYIHGYECGVTLEGTGLILGLTFPVEALNVGDSANQIVAYGLTDVQVVNDMAVVGTMNIMYTDAANGPLKLSLTPPDPASTPGMMTILDADLGSGNGLIGCMTSSGNWDNPVLGFNVTPGEIVATDAVTFDGVKALFR